MGVMRGWLRIGILLMLIKKGREYFSPCGRLSPCFIGIPTEYSNNAGTKSVYFYAGFRLKPLSGEYIFSEEGYQQDCAKNTHPGMKLGIKQKEDKRK